MIEQPALKNVPIPESKFLYRRVFSYTLMIATFVLLFQIVDALQGALSLNNQTDALADAANALAEIAKWLIGFGSLIVTYYMVAPSAEQIVRIVQAARLYQAAPTILRDVMQGGRETDYGSRYEGRYGADTYFPDAPFGDMR